MRTAGLILTVFLLSMASGVLADEDEPRISGFGFLKINFIAPNNGDVVNKETAFVHLMYKWVGAGFEASYKPKGDFFDIHFQATVQKGPFYLLGGFAADSTGADYAKAGVWYLDSFGKNRQYKILFCGVNYFATNGVAKSYFDGFLEPLYAVSEKVFIGVNLNYDHWWSQDRDWFLVGPIVYYRLTENIQPYCRLTHEWNFQEEKSWEANAIRFGLKFVF